MLLKASAAAVEEMAAMLPDRDENPLATKPMMIFYVSMLNHSIRTAVRIRTDRNFATAHDLRNKMANVTPGLKVVLDGKHGPGLEVR